MRNKLPSFRVMLVGAVLLATGAFVAFQHAGGSRVTYLPLLSYKNTTESGASLGQVEEVDRAQPVPGSDLLAESARRVLELPSVECKIRQRVDLFGQQLTGVGSYQQWSPNDMQRTRVRWELKFQVGENMASLQQINDGRFFWTRRDLPGEQSLSRVDLRTVRDVLNREKRLPADAVLRNWMALGGLSRLMHGLHENFNFGWAQPRIVDTTPVWVLVGTWNPVVLAELAPAAKTLLEQGRSVPIDRLPAHLPDLIVVVLSRDPRLPTFPYRIEYRRTMRGAARGTSADESAETDAPEIDADTPRLNSLTNTMEIAVIDLYEVNASSYLEPQQFVYQPPSSQEAVDDTERFLLQTLTPPPSDNE